MPNKNCLAELVSLVERFDKLDDAEDLAELKRNFPTSRDAVTYIMATFRIVDRKEEEKSGCDYPTKRVILEIYDEMADAIQTAFPYKTYLDHPPAHLGCCHSPEEATKA